MTWAAAIQIVFNNVGRVLVVIGIFMLTWYILGLIKTSPSLLNSAPFMTIVGLVMGTGFGSAVSYFLGSSQSSSSKDSTIATLATTASTQPQVQPPPDPKPLTDPFVIKE
jgi:hypothetical protein